MKFNIDNKHNFINMIAKRKQEQFNKIFLTTGIIILYLAIAFSPLFIY